MNVIHPSERFPTGGVSVTVFHDAKYQTIEISAFNAFRVLSMARSFSVSVMSAPLREMARRLEADKPCRYRKDERTLLCDGLFWVMHKRFSYFASETIAASIGSHPLQKNVCFHSPQRKTSCGCPKCVEHRMPIDNNTSFFDWCKQ